MDKNPVFNILPKTRKLSKAPTSTKQLATTTAIKYLILILQLKKRIGRQNTKAYIKYDVVAIIRGKKII
jgi:hypothetical protein